MSQGLCRGLLLRFSDGCLKIFYREGLLRGFCCSRFRSSPFTIKVPFSLLFCFNKETPKYKRPKGTTEEPAA